MSAAFISSAHIEMHFSVHLIIEENTINPDQTATM